MDRANNVMAVIAFEKLRREALLNFLYRGVRISDTGCRLR